MHSSSTSPEPDEAQVARRAAAEARVEAALDAIEGAQQLIDRATQALSAVIGLCPEYERMSGLYDQIRRAWHAINDKAESLHKRGALTLDHEPTVNEAAHWLSLGKR